jgi:hypothetical protein
VDSSTSQHVSPSRRRADSERGDNGHLQHLLELRAWVVRPGRTTVPEPARMQGQAAPADQRPAPRQTRERRRLACPFATTGAGQAAVGGSRGPHPTTRYEAAANRSTTLTLRSVHASLSAVVPGRAGMEQLLAVAPDVDRDRQRSLGRGRHYRTAQPPRSHACPALTIAGGSVADPRGRATLRRARRSPREAPPRSASPGQLYQSLFSRS